MDVFDLSFNVFFSTFNAFGTFIPIHYHVIMDIYGELIP
jgi:hypothetical protein